ncbi:alpha/beta hydrolase [Muriicola marianensis]|nr:alpha/beta hydrolase [Muriicola marianensis]
MKIPFFLCLIAFSIAPSTLSSQELTIRKGMVQDSVRINDSIPETFAVYLPTNYEPSLKWPVLFAMDMQGRGKQIVHMFREVAEEQGFIVAASNDIHDSLSIVQNTLVTSRMFNRVFSLFSIHKNRTYTAGLADGAQFATIVASLIKPVEGVISCGAGIPYKELINPKNPFQFIGIVGRSDHNFNNLLEDFGMTRTTTKAIGRSKMVDYLMVFEGGAEWPPQDYLQRALEILNLKSMSKGDIARDSTYVNSNYNRNMAELDKLVTNGDYLGAAFLADEMLTKFKGLLDLDELKRRKKFIWREKEYQVQSRKQNRYLQKEYFIREEYDFNLNDDVLTLNYNNLGWWNYQKGEIDKFRKSNDPFEKEMGNRLLGFLNALVEDNIELEKAQNPVNEEALSYLWMVKTISAPLEYQNYLNIISDSAKYEDFGTALFYLEELLKKGFTDKAALYTLKHTALLRITPEFNEIIEKYFKDARYDLIED